MTDISRLPGPVADRWDWQYQGACRDLDTELSSTQKANVVQRAGAARSAKAICATCPSLSNVANMHFVFKSLWRVGRHDRRGTTRDH